MVRVYNPKIKEYAGSGINSLYPSLHLKTKINPIELYCYLWECQELNNISSFWEDRLRLDCSKSSPQQLQISVSAWIAAEQTAAALQLNFHSPSG